MGNRNALKGDGETLKNDRAALNAAKRCQRASKMH